MLIFRVLKPKQAFTQQMQNKSNKTMEFTAGKADKNFTEERLTNYAGLTSVSQYIQSQGIGSLLDRLFPTTKQHATKFSTTQIMLAVVMASLSDVHRMNRIVRRARKFVCPVNPGRKVERAKNKRKVAYHHNRKSNC